MRKILIVMAIMTLGAMAQDAGKAAVADSGAREFSSQFGLAMANIQATVYKVRANSLPSYKHSKPFVIVWTGDGLMVERKAGQASATREVKGGQIEVYAVGTAPSVRAIKGKIHFTLIELNEPLHKSATKPSRPAGCESAVDLPQGGFACVIELGPNEEITIPKLGVSWFLISIGSEKVCYTIPCPSWETKTSEGSPLWIPGYVEHAMKNRDRKLAQFALIVPTPGEYK